MTTSKLAKGIVYLSLGVLSFAIVASLSRNLGESSYLAGAKYGFMLLFVVVLGIDKKRLNGDRVAIVGYYFFLFFSIFFTLLNEPDVYAIFAIAGYFLCFLIYLISSSDTGDLAGVVGKFIATAALIFAILNGVFIFDPDAYSLVKGQFSGFLSNANAFAGLAGLFFVFLISSWINAVNRGRRAITGGLILVYGAYIVMAGSRGVLVAVAAALFFLDVKPIVRSFALVAALILIVVLTLSAGLTQLDVGGFAQRDIFEQSGRGELLDSYLVEIANRSLIGTGLAEESGRIKSELSYLDIVLFSGIGAFGFAVFLIRTFLAAVRLTFKHKNGGWMAPIFVYVIAASVFEGYAANVMSLPTLLLYLVSGLVYASSRRKENVFA